MEASSPPSRRSLIGFVMPVIKAGFFGWASHNQGNQDIEFTVIENEPDSIELTSPAFGVDEWEAQMDLDYETEFGVDSSEDGSANVEGAGASPADDGGNTKLAGETADDNNNTALVHASDGIRVGKTGKAILSLLKKKNRNGKKRSGKV